MTLANAFVAGINKIYAKAGVSATYTPSGGESVTYTVIITHDLSLYGDTAEVQQATASVSIRASDLAAPPRRGDTFTIGGETYRVSAAVTSDELEHTVLVA